MIFRLPRNFWFAIFGLWIFFVFFFHFSTSDQNHFPFKAHMNVAFWSNNFKWLASLKGIFTDKSWVDQWRSMPSKMTTWPRRSPGSPSKNTWGCEIKKLGACGWRRLRGTLGQSPFSNKPSKKTDAINKGNSLGVWQPCNKGNKLHKSSEMEIVLLNDKIW